MDESTTNNDNNHDYKLEFQQLKAYYNFRLNLKQKLKKVNKNTDFEKNPYYLIDKKWFQNWKAHVAYSAICNERVNKNLKDKEINDGDENSILNLFKWNPYQKKISPLDNNDIYYNGEINPLSEFIIVDKNCYDFFVNQNNLPDERKKRFSINYFPRKDFIKIKSYSIFYYFQSSK